MDPYKALERVNSRETFVEFLAALRDDYIDEDRKERKNPSNNFGRGANGWEHHSIDAFIDAMHANGNHLPEEPSWREFAELLYMGKIYE